MICSVVYYVSFLFNQKFKIDGQCCLKCRKHGQYFSMQKLLYAFISHPDSVYTPWDLMNVFITFKTFLIIFLQGYTPVYNIMNADEIVQN